MTRKAVRIKNTGKRSGIVLHRFDEECKTQTSNKGGLMNIQNKE